jgi:hypothetical protein
MPSSDTINVLNRVLAILERSFPQYLRYARPYIPPGRENIMQTIDQIVAGQDALAARVSEQIFESGALPDHGEFPIEFTDTHDLAIDFLLLEAVDCLKQDVADLQACADALRLIPNAQSLASEALGMTKGHLELLQQLAVSSAAPTASTKFGATPAFANDVPVANEISGVPHRQEERKLAAGDPHSPG